MTNNAVRARETTAPTPIRKKPSCPSNAPAIASLAAIAAARIGTRLRSFSTTSTTGRLRGMTRMGLWTCRLDSIGTGTGRLSRRATISRTAFRICWLGGARRGSFSRGLLVGCWKVVAGGKGMVGGVVGGGGGVRSRECLVFLHVLSAALQGWIAGTKIRPG